MSKILIFAGTTEGRRLAEFTGRQQIPSCVCVATEYGGQLLQENEYTQVKAARMDQREMEELIGQKEILLAIDATHPYASVVSENIKKACENTGREYIRLLRSSQEAEEEVVNVESVEEAVGFLQQTTGNILVTTGSKELAKYTVLKDYQNRIYARILSTPEAVNASAELGIEGRHLICMQGPFSQEMNCAMLKEFQASWLVTKEAGKNGGFQEKIRAAAEVGAKVVLIGRPVKEEGLSLGEIKRLLLKRLGREPKRELSIIGIGMGTRETMTLEGYEKCREAQLLVGAGRMIEEFADWGKDTFVSYKPLEIREYIMAHPEYERIALLQSGDPGFYSGAKKLLEIFKEEEPKVYPGISSVVYLCSILGTSWEDVALASLHGRDTNMIAKIKNNKKVFGLIGKGCGVNDLCREMTEYGMGHLQVTVGEELSYAEQRIRTAAAEELVKEQFKDLCVVLVENPQAHPVVTHGIRDEEFIRDRVPMTKAEVRSISLSKLRLTRDAIVYDVGAGTGSVSLEAALQAEDGKVYAIEKKPEAAELIQKNSRKFGTSNLEIVEGLAPEVLKELPVPSHVFIGGSSGNLKEIMGEVLKKNPSVRIVLNCIALETLAEALDCIKELPVEEVDITAVTIGKAKEAGKYHLMTGQNPVYVIACTGGGAV